MVSGSNKKNKIRGMQRKLRLTEISSKKATTSTTIGVWFVVYSMRLVRTGYSVTSVSCSHILLAQNTTLITCAMAVLMTEIKCCVLLCCRAVCNSYIIFL
jgi:hypothetical protein